MGFDINLETERGKILKTVGDPKNLLHNLMERSISDDPLLAEIDWYGDTVFNRVQMPRFLSAWRVLRGHAQNHEEAKLADEVKALAEECHNSVHLYLKFIGD